MMTRCYPDLASASDWSCRVGNLIQPIRSTTQIWVVTRHQYGISALVSQTSFGGETSGSVAKCRLFSQATVFQSWVHSSLYLHMKNLKPDQHFKCLSPRGAMKALSHNSCSVLYCNNLSTNLFSWSVSTAPWNESIIFPFFTPSTVGTAVT